MGIWAQQMASADGASERASEPLGSLKCSRRGLGCSSSGASSTVGVLGLSHRPFVLSLVAESGTPVRPSSLIHLFCRKRAPPSVHTRTPPLCTLPSHAVIQALRLWLPGVFICLWVLSENSVRGLWSRQVNRSVASGCEPRLLRGETGLSLTKILFWSTSEAHALAPFWETVQYGLSWPLASSCCRFFFRVSSCVQP